MLNVLAFIFAPAALTLLIVFFVFFLSITASMKRSLQASQTENKNALARLEAETQRIHAEAAALIKQEHEKYGAELIEAQDCCIQELKKIQNELNNRVDRILKEIKAPLMEE
jgi:ElaB/YqjD/DUF883 family membrane-anchored ribosome-binding protein